MDFLGVKLTRSSGERLAVCREELRMYQEMTLFQVTIGNASSRLVTAKAVLAVDVPGV
jgi:hypothetical protein